MMIPLAFDLKSSAELLSVKPKTLKELIEKREIEGIKIGGEYRLSIFILSKLLRTTPETLLEFIEDSLLAQMIQEVEGDEIYTPEEGKEIYQQFLKREEENVGNPT
ncbi:helix-turn-helix domain-containing protein [bacterium]|nr:helix-turn-helix domain-containing protein [bacterium]